MASAGALTPAPGPALAQPSLTVVEEKRNANLEPPIERREPGGSPEQYQGEQERPPHDE